MPFSGACGGGMTARKLATSSCCLEGKESTRRPARKPLRSRSFRLDPRQIFGLLRWKAVLARKGAQPSDAIATNLERMSISAIGLECPALSNREVFEIPSLVHSPTGEFWSRERQLWFLASETCVLRRPTSKIPPSLFATLPAL